MRERSPPPVSSGCLHHHILAGDPRRSSIAWPSPRGATAGGVVIGWKSNGPTSSRSCTSGKNDPRGEAPDPLCKVSEMWSRRCWLLNLCCSPCPPRPCLRPFVIQHKQQNGATTAVCEVRELTQLAAMYSSPFFYAKSPSIEAPTQLQIKITNPDNLSGTTPSSPCSTHSNSISHNRRHEQVLQYCWWQSIA
uniref:Uncharacterized protein n=1 Tax=Triticum urartu TaxID=4572 RepID=A0A8R7R1F6_TRIUA